MVDLSTKYLGLELSNPLVVSAGPLTKNTDTAIRLEDEGAAALVMYSLFEEQIEHDVRALDHFTTQGTESYAEATDYIPRPPAFERASDRYIEQVGEIVDRVDIPVIGSLNGVSPGGWTSFAKAIEAVGAAALELNLYMLPTDPELSSAVIEERYLSVLREVADVVSIPIAVKLHPFFSNLANMVKQFHEAGAAGIVLFNRFYQPDIDLERLEVEPLVTLSSSDDLLLPLRWIAMLHGRVNVSIAATSGIHDAQDAIKALMAGADVAMMMTALLMHGTSHMSRVLKGVEQWLDEHEYESVDQLKGSMSHASVADPGQFERVHYVELLERFGVAPN